MICLHPYFRAAIADFAWLKASVLSLVTICSPVTTAAEEFPVLDLDRPLRWDFSGSWEKDFARSENWLTELKRTIALQQEAEERQRRRAESYRTVNPRPTIMANRRRHGANLVDLARLAEYVNRQSILQITQTKQEVKIERADDAALICGLSNDFMATFASPHGSEICGWDRHHLVFQITLPENLLIVQRFTVASDATSLRVVTSVSSKGSEPFNLIQVYNRFEEPPGEYTCVQTLSRGKVCTQAETSE